MKTISLTRGLSAFVSDEDYNAIRSFKWYAKKMGKTYYAARVTPQPNRKEIYMHRFILNPPQDMEVDHIDGNGLNNTRENIRIVTHIVNCSSRRMYSNNTTGHTGIIKSGNKWIAKIWSNYKNIHLGRHETIDDALRARQEGERKYRIK